MTTYQVQLEQDSDGRWSAWIDALPGCAVWGYSEDEALSALRDAAQVYIEDMIEASDEVVARFDLVVDRPTIKS